MDFLHRFPLRRLQPIHRWPAGRVALISSALAPALAIALFGGILSLPQPVQAQSLMSLGDNSRDVAILQRELQRRGYLDPASVTGEYDELTELAVLQFQGDRNLYQDGVAGPDTFAALGLSGQGGDSDLPMQPLDERELQGLSSQQAGTDRLVSLGELNTTLPAPSPGVAESSVAIPLDAWERRGGVWSEDRRVEDRRGEGRRGEGRRGEGRREDLSSVPRVQPAQSWPQGDNVASDEFDRRGRNQPVAQADRRYPYVLAIPGEGDRTLRDVQAVVPGAFASRDARGLYVQAGSFATRAEAEAEERYLRSKGLDARVIFRH